jgi:two-component system chemotaxis sensor kinase CheA
MSDIRQNFDDDSAENIIERLRDAFKDEAYELLTDMETALLELEKNPADAELISRVFRAMHTIKGSGAACELKEISAYTHELETFFDMVRKGRIAVTKEIIDLTLMARDQIKSLFDAVYRGGTADEARGKELLALFKKLHPAPGAKEAAAPAPSAPQAAPEAPVLGKNVTYRIRFKPRPGILDQGDPVTILDEIRLLGPCEIVAHTDAVPYLEDYKPSACYTYWDIILTTRYGKNAIEDVFIFVKDTSETKIDVIDEEDSLEHDTMTYKRLGEILLERGDVTPGDLQKALRSMKKIGEALMESGAVTPEKIESALAEQQHVREMREKRQGAETITSIRVATEKLDSLVDLVGELVTVQARLSQTALMHNIPGLLSIAEEVERLTAELRDKTMSVRMLPIGTTFGNFKRLFRDLSKDLGKEVELVTDGGETELDKTVIERLNDPLVHLIRNSLDHGIEQPDARMAAGKSRQGVIRLAAVHSGAHVLIQISDDGAGMDRDAIRAKALEKGLIDSTAELSDSELYSLIFTPGFSTAKKVTSVSGRGVGLDVVKRAIDALRGNIEITSAKGLGTTITLKLPLTLAIIDGLLVKLQEQHYVLPLSYVKECVELTRKDREDGHGRNIANVRGEIVPYIILREQFGIADAPPEREQIVITEVGGTRVGFVVDHVIGGHQTVIKNLGRYYHGAEGLSGATILGDGTVALILDVPKLAHLAERDERQVMKGSMQN